MKLTTVSLRGETHAALIDGDSVSITDLPDGLSAVRLAAADPKLLLDRVVEQASLAEITLLAPIPRPGKILGSGGNYRASSSAARPDEPGFFSKLPSSVVGPEVPIQLPTPSSTVVHEVELAIVIGVPGRDISREDAFDHVFGYTIVNDVSGRDVLAKANQKAAGKGFDTFCPMGPWIITPDELGAVSDLAVRSWVNDELRQDASTADWFFGVAELLAHASQQLTLESGDVITTGTPPDRGAPEGRTPWLVPGDVVMLEVVGVGRLRNPVVAGWIG